jgi:hypothetical protein
LNGQGPFTAGQQLSSVLMQFDPQRVVPAVHGGRQPLLVHVSFAAHGLPFAGQHAAPLAMHDCPHATALPEHCAPDVDATQPLAVHSSKVLHQCSAAGQHACQSGMHFVPQGFAPFVHVGIAPQPFFEQT